jgi:hypothetical protein
MFILLASRRQSQIAHLILPDAVAVRVVFVTVGARGRPKDKGDFRFGLVRIKVLGEAVLVHVTVWPHGVSFLTEILDVLAEPPEVAVLRSKRQTNPPITTLIMHMDSHDFAPLYCPRSKCALEQLKLEATCISNPCAKKVAGRAEITQTSAAY